MLPADKKRVWTEFGEYCEETSSRILTDKFNYN